MSITFKEPILESTSSEAIKLLPHGEEIQLIGEVIELGTDSISCVSCESFPESYCYEDSCGNLLISQMSFMELVAQAAAIGKIATSFIGSGCSGSGINNSTINGSGAEAGEHRHRGAVVRARGFNFTEQPLAQQTSLRVEASWSKTVAGAFEVSGRIYLAASGDFPISTGSLTIVEIE